MSGTDLACAATFIPYAFLHTMSGTDLAYAATLIWLRERYAMSGTEIAYAATSPSPSRPRCPFTLRCKSASVYSVPAPIYGIEVSILNTKPPFSPYTVAL
eukprot:2787325-Rhodomonas_salina.1